MTRLGRQIGIIWPRFVPGVIFGYPGVILGHPDEFIMGSSWGSWGYPDFLRLGDESSPQIPQNSHKNKYRTVKSVTFVKPTLSTTYK